MNETTPEERSVTAKMLLHNIDMGAMICALVEQQNNPQREFKMYLNAYYNAGQKLYKYFESHIVSKHKDWGIMNEIQDTNDKLLQLLRTMTLAAVEPEMIDRITNEFVNEATI